ncbi:LPS assembly lipoprotein LptE [Vibrio sp. Of7-15]|uniref:LPS-assembly lipoprotein LptE n=1 Tax=Vibrio sp. Of7-15 TaxID=2724879 RepID=UPI001EF3CBF5|nr:LPS assembly lipoprotein LptE [Vibrio sp. Of7-15]MCG7499465.1 LPS assembly lipoprotein LptE [Vibrio sp. Of7-15]
MFSIKTALRTLLVAAVIMTTASCGFHLRGNYLLPEELTELSLTSFDQYGDLTRDVRDQFRLHGINEVPPSPTTPNLHLISESTSSQTLSLYQNSRAAEYELTYTARYRVVVPEKENQTYTTSVNRSYLDNPLTALAKSVERDLITSEMREQAARQILRQMARLKAPLEEENNDFNITTETVDDAKAGQNIDTSAQ